MMRDLKAKFARYDKSGDGKLDLGEMSALLRMGNPNMTDAQLKLLFNGVDKNGDGRVDFDEFVDYIYSRSTDAQAPPAPEAPEDVRSVFEAFAGGPAMDGAKFAKLCRDCRLVDNTGFLPRDVDATFANVAGQGRRAIGYPGFLKALVIVAKKKDVPIDDIYMQVGDSVPVTRATKASAVRFHDDKSSYTGTHARDGRHGQAPSGAAFLDDGAPPRRSQPAARPAARASSSVPPPRAAEPSDDDEEGVDSVFFKYAGKSDDMDGREFAKLCSDCKLFDRKFTKADVDIVFAKVCFKGERRIGLRQFQQALTLIADRKEVAPYFVLKNVKQSAGPQLSGTKADAVRFHDDKSTYTGTHAY